MSVGTTEPIVDTDGQSEIGESIDAQETVAPEPVEEPSSEPLADNDGSDSAPPEEPPPPEWITDDVRALASSYGIEEEDLVSFDSGNDFHRACRLIDKRMTHGISQETTATDEPKLPTSDNQTAAEAALEDLTLDPAFYESEGYNEDTVRIVKAAKLLQDENRAFRQELANMSQSVRQEFNRIHQERQQAQHEMELSRFHDVMDGMDEEMFGGTKELNEDTDGRRAKVWDAYRTIVKTLPQSEKPPTLAVLVKRATMLAFGDEIIASEKKKLINEINAQARGRRPSPGKGKAGGIGSGVTGKPETLHEEALRLANAPEIASIFDRSHEDNGHAPQ